MRIAALYDIHANLPALEAVLAEIDRERVDLIVVGGDIAWGPFPSETIDLLRSLENTAFIRGTADREVAQRVGADDGLDEITADITLWAADQLPAVDRDWLAELDERFVGEADGIGNVLFCHGSPRSDEEPITPLTPQQRLRRALQGVGERIVVCGHTHMQFRHEVDGLTLVNAGSVGLPYQGESGAFWLLLGPETEFRTTAFDVDAATTLMRDSGCPHVEEVFIDTLLHPPGVDQVATHMEKAVPNTLS